jgi:hypothetical protein
VCQVGTNINQGFERGDYGIINDMKTTENNSLSNEKRYMILVEFLLNNSLRRRIRFNFADIF